jgi:hypothetical protein
MRRIAATLFIVITAFSGGWLSHVLYQRWQSAELTPQAVIPNENSPLANFAGQSHPVRFVPWSAPEFDEGSAELPVLVARDVDKIRALAGRQARIRGRVFRVGHSAKSNTYFLNFGPSREALTAVIFASSVELFEKARLAPKSFENRNVELMGQVKDHPQYGLEVVIEEPKQIKVLP